MYGFYFEDFEARPLILKVAEARTVTQDDINKFAALSGDTNTLDIDPEFAANRLFRQTIALGMLTQSIAMRLVWEAGLFKGAQVIPNRSEWNFTRAVYPGDTLYAEFEVVKTEKIPRKKGGDVVFSVVMKNQNKKLVGSGNWTLFVSGRPQAVTAPVKQPAELDLSGLGECDLPGAWVRILEVDTESPTPQHVRGLRPQKAQDIRNWFEIS